MNKVRKFDLKALAASAVLFAILQGLMSAEVIGKAGLPGKNPLGTG